ncbi:hypothetical protein VPH35_031482 [Triticum aestivum]
MPLPTASPIPSCGYTSSITDMCPCFNLTSPADLLQRHREWLTPSSLMPTDRRLPNAQFIKIFTTWQWYKDKLWDVKQLVSSGGCHRRIKRLSAYRKVSDAPSSPPLHLQYSS